MEVKLLAHELSFHQLFNLKLIFLPSAGFMTASWRTVATLPATPETATHLVGATAVTVGSVI